jgi:starch-binding outer membrane protein, SusD/RagB family
MKMKNHIVALACLTLAIGACKDSTSVPDLNNPSLSTVSGALTPGNLQLLITGVLNRERQALDYPFYVVPATMARDVWYLASTESRFESETLEGPPSPGGFIATRSFTTWFSAQRAEQSLIDAVPKATVEFTAGDKLAITGFVRTLKANDLYRALETRDSIGLPVALSDPNSTPAPIRCKPAVLAYLSALLDSGYTDLQAAVAAGTTTFPAALPSGWSSIGGDYGAVANEIKYNRGLKGKIEVYRGLAAGGTAQNFTDAKTALDIALTGVTQDAAGLAGGPYYQFSTLSGEITNLLFDSQIHFTPSVHDSLQAGDLRGAKIITQSTPARLIVDGVTFVTPYDPAVTVTSNPANQTRPIPILKNEELFLVRAQAKIGLSDYVGAAQDMNIVRSVSGGPALPPYTTFATQAAAINAVLYEKRYSLLTDGAQRLVDLRAYGRLNNVSFPNPGTNPIAPYASDPYNKVLPYPQSEIDARSGNTTCQ